MPCYRLSDITYDFDEADDDDDAKGRLGRIVDFVIKPVYFAVRITIPLVDKDKWDWRLTLVWPVVFFPFTFFVFDGFLLFVGPVPLLPFLVAIGIGVAVFMYLKLRTRRHKPIYPLFHLGMAFFAGVAWISLMADELVTVLAVLGVITGINQTILGLTILAWGNSVPGTAYIRSCIVTRCTLCACTCVCMCVWKECFLTRIETSGICVFYRTTMLQLRARSVSEHHTAA